MKKCSCAITPTLFPVRSLIGITASTPTWKYLPAQMTPGFIVPVVCPSSPWLCVHVLLLFLCAGGAEITKIDQHIIKLTVGVVAEDAGSVGCVGRMSAS